MCVVLDEIKPDFVQQHTSTPDAGDSTGEVGHETVMIDGQCDVYAGHGRVDEAGRIADGAAACAVEIARLRLDLHRQIEAFHQTWIQCDGRGKGSCNGMPAEKRRASA